MTTAQKDHCLRRFSTGVHHYWPVLALVCGPLLPQLANAQASGVVVISPSSVAFSSQLVGSTSAVHQVTLTNRTGALLTSLSLAATGDFGQTNNCPGSLAPKAGCMISITFSPLAAGVRNGAVTITDSAGTQTVPLSGIGYSLASITVLPAVASIAPGTHVQLQATGTFSDGSTQGINSIVAWSSSNPATATVDANGRVTALASGSSTMTATLGSILGTATVNVTSASLVSIAIASSSFSEPQGITQQLTAVGKFTDGTAQNIGSSVQWTSSHPSVATVNGAGLVSSISAGKTKITATLGSVAQSRSFTVTPVTLASITVTPSNPALPTGSSQQFHATANFSDGSNRNITALVAWSSSDLAVATIGTGGQAVTGFVAGGTAISAILGNVTGTTQLTVAATKLVSIAVTGPQSAPAGTVTPFAATGTFGDGAVQDVTSAVHWTSSAPAIATVSSGTGPGRVKGVSAGGVTISAVRNVSVSGSASFTVSPAALVSITISPANPTVPLGELQQFTATGHYTDQSTQDLTSQVTWSSSIPAVAMISNDQGTQGQAATLAVGSTVIGASLGSIAASTQLTVGPAQLVSLSVAPLNPSLAVGATQQFTAAGTYSDGSVQDVTSLVTWASSAATVATISSQGLAQAVSAGTTTISATLGALMASTTLTVTPAVQLVSLAVTPPTASILVGQTQQFTATGTFSDGSMKDLTTLVNWSANPATVATVGNSAPTQGIALGIGPGMATVTATLGSVSGSASLTVNGGPTVVITSPTNLSFLDISPTTVNGTVSDPNATISVNGILTPNSNGSFSVSVPMIEGNNVLTATAQSASGLIGSASIQVTLDTMPPRVTINAPPAGFATTGSTVDVAGIVNDIVVGTVNSQQVTVTVNGTNAQVANRTFLASSISLSIGPNTITATGTDRAGNSNTTSITVTRNAPAPQPQIQSISGDGQSGAIGTQLPVPLVVALTDATGQPVPGVNVIFKITQNNGMLTSGSQPAGTVIVPTNAQGQAQALWTLGFRSGAGSDIAQAYAIGFSGTAMFTASAVQAAAAHVVIDAGNSQTGVINQTLPKPLIAVVTDAGFNRLANVPVTFTVVQGGGNIGGQQTITVNTDSDGRAAAALTLGLQEGTANNLVTADFPSDPGFPASFTASGRSEGLAANTSISGVVLDNSNTPIPGVTVRAILAGQYAQNPGSLSGVPSAQTDPNGQFILTQAPVGATKIFVDGSTATRPGTYPSLEYDLVSISGQSNTLGLPVYLLPLNPLNQLCVTETTGGGTLTISDAPGFSLTFAPGQVTFPGGSKQGCVGVTVVHGDKVPMVPGFGQQPRFIVTIQPSGALFSPPAPITLPNVDGLAPRAVTEMYSFDHDLSSFVAIGTGTVSDDGQVIRSNNGVGVLKAGWHCGGNSTSTGSAADCGPCQSCSNIAGCTPDPLQTTCISDCVQGVGFCQAGACTGTYQPIGTLCAGGTCDGAGKCLTEGCPGGCNEGSACSFDGYATYACVPYIPYRSCPVCDVKGLGVAEVNAANNAQMYWDAWQLDLHDARVQAVISALNTAKVIMETLLALGCGPYANACGFAISSIDLTLALIFNPDNDQVGVINNVIGEIGALLSFDWTKLSGVGSLLNQLSISLDGIKNAANGLNSYTKLAADKAGWQKAFADFKNAQAAYMNCLGLNCPVQ